MMLTMMIPYHVVLVPQYILFLKLGWVDTYLPLVVPRFLAADGFFIFLMVQFVRQIPRELDEAARIEGCSWIGLLWRVYVPLAKPTMLAFGLVSVSHHWNNYIWPLIITSSVETRPLTVGLSIFATTDSGIEWSIITAATLITSAPLLIGFLLFQRQFVQSFMRAGIK
jgi:sn-glycerol 3-phosphate transport system permease protein